jgi:Zn-dependent peptidase ImmA (M78 family)
MHRDLYVNPRPAESKDQEMEALVNTFAAHFLVPDAGLRDLFTKNVGRNNIGIEDIIFLKRHFRVSAQMMLRCLRDNNLISPREHDDQLDHLRRAEPDKAKELAPLTLDLVATWQSTCRFQHLARKAALAEMVSSGKLAELLGVDLAQVKTLVQSWRREIAVVSFP